MIISIVLFMAILSWLLWLIFFHAAAAVSEKTWSAADNSAAAKCPDCVRRRIDGVYVKPDQANLPPVAVMIDNHPDARPQSGIEKANLVYEAEVEGYYTRLMAIFASGDTIARIGPVRSARPYFVDWAQELNAVYVHCGGSPEALVDLIKSGITDLNEFYNGHYFWRSTDRVAPHNIYISSDNFTKYSTDNNIAPTAYGSWQYKEDSPSPEASSSDEVDINYQVADFRVKWVYDKTGNDYIRYANNQPELTADRDLIIAKNIIIQIVPAAAIDAELRLKMDDVGSGTATICLDGVCQPGLWKKQSALSRTEFTTAVGQAVKFNAGPTWVEVMRPNE
ncbi:MAG TPA: DUF3048 domain-containing protein [Candidatus Nanoarchaeia archaeon]|nr:DUF3048 domain-containing protein [Candidatus Nanoarchaeia archaeon]